MEHSGSTGGGGCLHVLCPCVASTGVLHPELGCPAQERHRDAGVEPEETMGMFRGLELLSSKDRLGELNLFSPQRRMLQGSLTAVFQYLRGTYNQERDLT